MCWLLEWYRLGNELKEIDKVNQVLSVPHSFLLQKNKEEKKFELKSLVNGEIQDQTELDSIAQQFHNLPFYEGLLYNSETNVSLMAVTIDKSVLDTEERMTVVGSIMDTAKKFEVDAGQELHYSGLPFIRSFRVGVVSNELGRFLLLALLATAVILFLLFRSFSRHCIIGFRSKCFNRNSAHTNCGYRYSQLHLFIEQIPY